MSGLLGGAEVWIPRALVLLVAAVPCAFALSVPVSVVAAIGSASRAGILVKCGAALETLGRLSWRREARGVFDRGAQASLRKRAEVGGGMVIYRPGRRQTSRAAAGEAGRF